MSQFNPYVDNGGTAVAFKGDNFVVIGADTRMSQGYSICSRENTKLFHLTGNAIIATSGMVADRDALFNLLEIKIKRYEQDHKREPSVSAIAQLLSTILYSRRFFPYYTFNILAGIDPCGTPRVYSYDAIGSFEDSPSSAVGSGQKLVQPILDNQITRLHQKIAKNEILSENDSLQLCKDVIASAAERDIYTGDFVEVVIVKTEGVVLKQKDPLRRD